MADTRRCTDTCGCAVPCPGGTSCRCTDVTAQPVTGRVAHATCSCGEHCGCNPCTACGKTERLALGRASCTCGPACTCVTCVA